MFVKKLFCRHVFEKSVSIESERKGIHNYVYCYVYLKCEKCGYCYQIKTLDRIERGFYRSK